MTKQKKRYLCSLVARMFLVAIHQKDCTYCAPVAINPNLWGEMEALSKTIQLTLQTPVPPTGCTAFTSRRDQTSTCSHTGYNYRQLHGRLPSQPHPHTQKRGSLPLSLTIRLPGSSWAQVLEDGGFEAEAMCPFSKLKWHHVRPQQNDPAAVQPAGPIR